MSKGLIFHRGAAEVAEKEKGIELDFKKSNFFLRFLRVSAVNPFFVFLVFFPFLQGCSLLFVAKGGTHYIPGKEGKVPQAASQAVEMEEPNVVEYKVLEDDTFRFISEKYFGKPAKASKIARDNHLNPKGKPKAGTVLKIVSPLYFLTAEEQAKKAPPKPARLPKTKATGTPLAPSIPSPSPTPEPTPQKVDKVSRPKVNNAFAPGEKLKFEIRALSILGGYGSMEVGDYTSVNNRPCEPLIIRANAILPLSSIFDVNDLQTSYFDSVDFIPWQFKNKVVEGNYKAHNEETFDQIKHKAVRIHNGETPENMDIAPFSQDIISCFYYFRLLPLELGKTYDIPTQSGGKNYHLIVSVIKQEKITVPAGTFDCFRIKPIIKQGTIFRTNEDIDCWVTTDSRHIPVKIQTGIVIGSIDVDLLEASLPPLASKP